MGQGNWKSFLPMLTLQSGEGFVQQAAGIHFNDVLPELREQGPGLSTKAGEEGDLRGARNLCLCGGGNDQWHT